VGCSDRILIGAAVGIALLQTTLLLVRCG